MIPQPGGAAASRDFSSAKRRLHHRRQLAHHGTRRHRQQERRCRDAFVPTHRTLAFAELADASAPGMRANPNPLYRQSFLAVLPIAIVSPALGMAEGALADFLAMAGVRTTAVPSPAATAAWPSSPPCSCGSPRRAPASTRRAC